MATGVLVIGVGKATRLLGHLALTEKEYLATVRLGQATDTGDAEGTVVSAAPASELTLARLRAAAAALTGEIQQVPPAVSAIKVGGRRAYQLAREGTAPVLAARPVTVHEFTISDPRPAGGLLDVTAAVRCSSGTYVRALARDLGESLGVGGHLTMLRRTRVGPYRLSAARRAGRARCRLPGHPAGGGGRLRLPRPGADRHRGTVPVARRQPGRGGRRRAGGGAGTGWHPGRAARGPRRPGQAAGRLRALTQHPPRPGRPAAATRVLPARSAWQAWVTGER